MVFWRTYPWLPWIQSFWSSSSFQSLVFSKDAFLSPTGTEAILVSSDDKKQLTTIRTFLQKHFGTPPTTPILDIPEEILLGTKDYILIVQDDKKDIIGCIRYHWMGYLETETRPVMYVVDCFCIRSDWRKKGVGDYLLTTLHCFANEHHIPYCLFLKEGPSLSILSKPFYSGVYVYQRVTPSSMLELSHLSTKDAYKILDIFHELNPDICMIRKEEKDMHLVYWRLYRMDQVIILVGVQSAYQWFKEEGKKQRMGWVTVWMETPNTTDIIRQKVANQVCCSMDGIFDYLWMNQESTGYSTNWILDGAFHWYHYQWCSSLHIKKSYCLLQ